MASFSSFFFLPRRFAASDISKQYGNHFKWFFKMVFAYIGANDVLCHVGPPLQNIASPTKGYVFIRSDHDLFRIIGQTARKMRRTVA